MNNQQQQQQQPLQKVTKSHYIVTYLGQLPFMLFTQMARTWAIKEDSLNTSIIHWYSTPRFERVISCDTSPISISAILGPTLQLSSSRKLAALRHNRNRHRRAQPSEWLYTRTTQRTTRS